MPDDRSDPRRQERLEALWDAARALPDAERKGFLDQAAADDPALRAELETLIANADRAEALFDRFQAVAYEGVREAMTRSLFSDVRDGLAERYTLERELGHGGMGTVYLAQDLRHHRQVAVKVLNPELAAVLGRERFLREIEIAANLRHPHILPLFDSGVANGLLYYVMPYEQGRSLRERIARERTLPIQDVIRILRDVLDALAHAHEHGIVHRDIKPDNVLVSGRHALITDFGIARALSDATAASKVTTEGVALGTPAYMAPEQAAAHPNVDHRADLYAVGILAYEMLTGQPPFTGATGQQVLTAHLTQMPAPVTTHRPTVPADLAALVMKCLEKQPADRFQRADEMLAQLETAVTPSGGSTPVISRAPSRWRRIATIATVTLAAVGITAWQLTRDRSDLDGNRVAIAPFEFVSGPESLRTLGTILADLVTNDLTMDTRFDVTPFAGVLAAARAAGTDRAAVDAKALARETRAGVLVSGNYYVRGDSLSIQARVDDVIQDRPLAAVEVVTVPLADEVRGMEAVRQRVVVALSSRFDANDPFHRSAALVDLPMNVEAYREYAGGVERFAVDDFAAALAFFYNALDLDPTSAAVLNMAALSEWLANANLPKVDSLLNRLTPYKSELRPYELARYDWLRAWLDGNLMGSLRATRQMSALIGNTTAPHAQDALRLNYLDEALSIQTALQTPVGRRSSWTWRHLTYVRHARGEHKAELAAARDGIDALGQTADLLSLESRALAASGRTPELLRQLEKLRALDAGHPGLRVAAHELRWHGHPEFADTVGRLAERSYRDALARTPTDELRILLAQTLSDLGDDQNAVAMFDSLAVKPAGPDTGWQRNNLDVVALGYLGLHAARRGDSALADTVVARLGQLRRPFLLGTHVYWQARIAAELGQCDRTAQLLEQGQALGASPYYHSAYVGLEVPQFRSLDCPAFNRLRVPRR